MIISIISSVLDGVNSVRQYYRSRSFTSDIMDSLFVDGERVLYWRYARKLKGGSYATFSIIPRYPHPGYIIRQGTGMHIATPEILRSFWKRLRVFIFSSSRPYLQVGLPVAEFIAPTLQEARHACIERGKFEKQIKKSDKDIHSMPKSLIQINYRNIKVLFRGSRAVDLSDSMSVNAKFFDIKSGRVMDPEPAETIDIKEMIRNEPIDWNIKLAAEEGIGWRVNKWQKEWQKLEFIYRLAQTDDRNTNNANVSIANIDLMSPYWTGRKAFFSKTLSDVLSRLGIDCKDVATGYGIKLCRKPKNSPTTSVRITLRDHTAVNFYERNSQMYEFSFLWNGANRQISETKATVYSDVAIENIDSECDDTERDGVINISRILPILELFGITAEREYPFKIRNHTQVEHDNS